MYLGMSTGVCVRAYVCACVYARVRSNASLVCVDALVSVHGDSLVVVYIFKRQQVSE